MIYYSWWSVKCNTKNGIEDIHSTKSNRSEERRVGKEKNNSNLLQYFNKMYKKNEE